VDDLAVEGHDGDLLGADLDDGGDVLVGLVLVDVDAFSEEVDASVGSDVADDFDPALCWQSCRWLVRARERVAELAVPHEVRGGSAVG